MAEKRRRWIWIAVLVAIPLVPALLFALASWTKPQQTGTIAMAVFQALPPSVRLQPAAWNMMNAYLRATIPDDQPREVKQETKRRKRADYLVVALGDSITAGQNIDPDKRWTFRLQKLMHHRLRANVNVVNAGVPGEIAPLGAKRVARDVLALKPNLAIIGYLINDGRIFGPGLDGQGQTLVTYDEYVGAMRAMVSQVRNARIPVLVYTCQPIQPNFFGFEHANWATLQEIVLTARVLALQTMAKENDVPLADSFTKIAELSDPSALYDPDHMHLNAEGNKLVAQIIFQTWAEAIYPSLIAQPAAQ